MAQIRVTPDQLRSRASEYRNQADDVEEVIKRLDSLISSLQSEWEGHSAERYISQYQELRPSFASMQKLITDLASSLDQEATKFEEADS